jgi:hypothetical protein
VCTGFHNVQIVGKWLVGESCWRCEKDVPYVGNRVYDC